MSWNDLPRVKKGNMAEEVVDRHIIDMGFIPYRPCANGAHPFDRLCASRDKQHIFIADSKGKPRRHSYPDTGIDIRHFNDYALISYEHNLRVYLVFVDEEWGRIYGNFLDELLKPCRIKNKDKYLDYPRKETGIDKLEKIYFPIASMQMLGELEEEDIQNLKNASTRRLSHQEVYNNGIDWNDIGMVVQNSFI